jgi:hypothetical protein
VYLFVIFTLLIYQCIYLTASKYIYFFTYSLFIFLFICKFICFFFNFFPFVVSRPCRCWPFDLWTERSFSNLNIFHTEDHPWLIYSVPQNKQSFDFLYWHKFNQWKYCHVYVCDDRRDMDWWLDLLTTYTHHSELKVITALSLIYAICKSTKHPVSLFPTCCLHQPLPGNDF